MPTLKRSIGYLFTLMLLSALVFGLWNRQAIIDWYRLRDYTPPADVAALAEHTTMNDLGKKLFYVHKPQLEDEAAFNESCSTEEQTIVLGCYISHRSIHIFDVDDPRLQGIREVTAAHEMLHAAYDRLDSSERQEVDLMTVTYYDSIKQHDERLRKVVESYMQRDPSSVNGELHSILATEVRDLPPELEDYYARYFTNRTAIVDYSEQYEEVFTQQQQKIQSLKDEIEALETGLHERMQAITASETEIQQEAARLNTLRRQDQIEAYNAAVPGYNQLVNEYKRMIDRYNSDVQRLNNLIADYNDLAVQQKELYDAIDSSQTEL